MMLRFIPINIYCYLHQREASSEEPDRSLAPNVASFGKALISVVSQKKWEGERIICSNMSANNYFRSTKKNTNDFSLALSAPF